MPPDWRKIRCEFPSLARWTHLNTATFGQIPRAAVEATARHFAHRDELACSDFLVWFDDMDRVRAKIARLISCAPDDIAFVPNASLGLSILLSGIEWKRGDEVVTLRAEFPNNPYAASALARHGVGLIEVDSWDSFYSSLSPRTRLVLLSTLNYTTGFRPPLQETAAALRKRGILLYLDGTQSVGVLRFDVTAVQPDFMAVDGYKWLLCPNGAGFIYVPQRVREWLPPNVIGWRSDRNWRNVDQLHHGAPAFLASAEKYEGGMISFALLYAMEASIDLILDIGPDAIEQRVLDLAAKTRDILAVRGADVERFSSPIVAARFAGCNVSKMAAALKERRILVAARHGYLRVSPHFYNDESDLENLQSAIS